MPQKVACKILDVIAHGGRVYTVLMSPSARLPRFSPGQFLHLALDPFEPGDFWPDSRVFSIASAPSQKDQLRITYAVKGGFTMRMESELVPGRLVWVKLPYGEFIVDRQKDACLIAGGTGITAFTAFLGELPANHPHKVHLLYGARQPELLIYRSLAEEAARRCNSLHIELFSEEPASADAGLRNGRLDISCIWDLMPNRTSLTYYIAGPPAMIQGLSRGLTSRGIDPCQVVIDAWE